MEIFRYVVTSREGGRESEGRGVGEWGRGELHTEIVAER